MIRGLESGIFGMEVGETRELEIAPDEAFGERNEELAVVLSLSEFPDHIKPEVGLQLQIKQEQGRQLAAVITDISEDTLTLDANHPLSGQTLHFEIELLEITDSA